MSTCLLYLVALFSTINQRNCMRMINIRQAWVLYRHEFFIIKFTIISKRYFDLSNLYLICILATLIEIRKNLICNKTVFDICNIATFLGRQTSCKYAINSKRNFNYNFRMKMKYRPLIQIKLFCSRKRFHNEVEGYCFPCYLKETGQRFYNMYSYIGNKLVIYI